MIGRELRGTAKARRAVSRAFVSLLLAVSGILFGAAGALLAPSVAQAKTGTYNSTCWPNSGPNLGTGTTHATCHLWFGVDQNGGQMTGNSPNQIGTNTFSNALSLYAGHTLTFGASWQHWGTWGAPSSCPSSLYLSQYGFTLWTSQTIVECGYWVLGVTSDGIIVTSDLVDWYNGSTYPSNDEWRSPTSVTSNWCAIYGCGSGFMYLNYGQYTSGSWAGAWSTDGQICTAVTNAQGHAQWTWCDGYGGDQWPTPGFATPSSQLSGGGYNSFGRGTVIPYANAVYPDTCGASGCYMATSYWGSEALSCYSKQTPCAPPNDYTYAWQSTGNFVVYKNYTGINWNGGVLWNLQTAPGLPAYSGGTSTNPSAYQKIEILYQNSGTPTATSNCAYQAGSVTGFKWVTQRPNPNYCYVATATAWRTNGNWTIHIPPAGDPFFIEAVLLDWSYTGGASGSGAGWGFSLAHTAGFHGTISVPAEAASISVDPQTLTATNSLTVTAHVTNVSDISGTNNNNGLSITENGTASGPVSCAPAPTNNAGNTGAFITGGTCNSAPAHNWTCDPETTSPGGSVFTYWRCTTSATISYKSGHWETFSAHSGSASSSTTSQWFTPTVTPTLSQSGSHTAATACVISGTTANCPTGQTLQVGVQGTWLDPRAPVNKALDLTLSSKGTVVRGGPTNGRLTYTSQYPTAPFDKTMPAPATGSCSSVYGTGSLWRPLFACSLRAWTDTGPSTAGTTTVSAGIHSTSTGAPWLAKAAALNWWSLPTISNHLANPTPTAGQTDSLTVTIKPTGGGNGLWFTQSAALVCEAGTVVAESAVQPIGSSPTQGASFSVPTYTFKAPHTPSTFTIYDVAVGNSWLPSLGGLPVGSSCAPLASGTAAKAILAQASSPFAPNNGQAHPS